MKNPTISALFSLVMVVAMACPSWAAATTSKLKNNLQVTGNLAVGGTTTHTGAVTNTGNMTVGGTLGVTGAATVGGTLGVTGAASLTVPLTAANINGANKVKLIRIPLAPNTGACADGTVYRGIAFPGRICTVKKVTLSCQTPPSVGTDVIKVLKASSAGNTLLSAATFDANTLVANTASSPALTATAADLALTATEGIYAEYSAGTQTVDGIGVEAMIEVELADY